MLNFIQLGLGLAAVVCIFIGLLTTIRSLDKNDSSKTISKETIIKSMVLIAVGLLFYSGVKTCSNMMTEGAEEYDIAVIYMASVVEVVKLFGFLILVPIVIRLLAARTPSRKEDTAS